jgi:RNA polymerase sigma-70 factor, ECF subfamily
MEGRPLGRGAFALSDADDSKLDSAIVATLYSQHAEELRRFLFGLLRDGQLVQDVMQTTFIRLAEVGHTSQEQTRKAWLFRVAYNEAMLCKRRAGVHQKAVYRLTVESETESTGRPGDELIRRETAEAVRDELERLTPEQQDVVRKRIYEGKTFAEIARELQAPLGTVLGRMHSALRKLRERLTRSDE